MRIPEFIGQGQTFGVCAPSFGASTEPYISRFNLAVDKFEQAGYHVKAGETCRMGDGLGISTSPERAAKDLEDFYLDDESRAVISCGGGEMMCQTVSLLDFHRLGEAKAKWFMGYSDNTNFIFPLATISGVAGIYGPNFTGFGKPWEQAELDALSLLEGRIKSVCGYPRFQSPEADEKAAQEDPLGKYLLDSEKHLVSYVADKSPAVRKLRRADREEELSASGILLGGCLDVLANLCGTQLDNMAQFNKREGDVLWLLESCDANPMEIRRQVWHLENAGWFDNAAAFIVGRPLSSWKQEMMGVNQYNAVTDIIGHHGVPVIMDADVGHIGPAVPLVIGAECKVTALADSLRIDFRL